MLTLRGQGQLWDPNAQMGSTPFHLAHQGGPDLRLMSALAGVYDAAAPSLRFIAPHCDEHQSRVGTAKSYLGRRPDRIGQFGSGLRRFAGIDRFQAGNL